VAELAEAGDLEAAASDLFGERSNERVARNTRENPPLPRSRWTVYGPKVLPTNRSVSFSSSAASRSPAGDGVGAPR